ncbi:MAG TPA: gamma-glutamyl-gamma-aminobutyrate hydrolase family protein [Capsulimonadaceae bacterium]|jgi:putative glutamine amidotransferase
MSYPIIAITAGRINKPTLPSEMQQVVSGCDVDYIESVVRAGGAPILIPRHTDIEAARAVVAVADGVLFTGGGDVCSLLYGEEPHRAVKYQDPARDAAEVAIALAAIERGIPIVGVCRGIQILNVALGGTLIQDIPSQVDGAMLHYTKSFAPVAVHSIDIEPGTLLEKLLGAPTAPVNSYHHQAVGRVAEGLKVNARARDGVIEGIEFADGRPLLAVQYHPEELSADDQQFQLYFDWLITEARRRA